MAAGTTIQHKRKAGAFVGGDLAAGEFGVDTTNGLVYFSTNGSTVSTVGGGGHDAVTLDSTVADVFGLTGQALTADDPGADSIPFWDDSASKMVYATIGDGLTMTGTTLSAKVVNVWLAESTSVFSTATTIPIDNTIPQSGEGAEILTKSITPSSTSNYLKFTVSCCTDASTTMYACFAVFQDSVADAKYSTSQLYTGLSYMELVSFTFLLPVPSTSVQTWKLRAGPSTGTLYINQTYAASPLFGTTDKVTMLIEEVTLT